MNYFVKGLSIFFVLDIFHYLLHLFSEFWRKDYAHFIMLFDGVVFAILLKNGQWIFSNENDIGWTVLIKINFSLLYVMHTVIKNNRIFLDKPSSEIKNVPAFLFYISNLKIKVKSFTILYLDKIKVIW